ncbi:hypothetical protein E2C01_039230 [Portunus trituberculatus]|uniref:Uncharacterized protein n=1 Tax=Portunus trituberculatus TaxID=210409 RepID=A0A5B7FK76_PORTR|nr:hypothetical protein [Portunus trituberculatus]
MSWFRFQHCEGKTDVRPAGQGSRNAKAMSSSHRKRRDKDSMDLPAKKRKSPLDEEVKDGSSQSRPECSSPLPVPGPSHTYTPAECLSGGNNFTRLSALLSDLIEKLYKGPAQADVSQGSHANFSAFHNVSSSEDEANEFSECLPDPLDDLDALNCSPPSHDSDESNYLTALRDLSGHFHSEEQTVVNYINQLRKEVAKIHINDSALADLCKWECEVGKDDLFPFDVTKKCEEIHKARKLERPSFCPYKSSGRRFATNKQTTKRLYQVLSHSQSCNQTRPVLGQRHSQGKGMHLQKPPQ